MLTTGRRNRVKVITSSNASVEGTVYTADPLTSLLILHTGNSSNITPAALTAPAGAYRLIPLSQISSFTLLSPAPSSSTTTPPTAQLDASALSNRLSTALAAAQTAASRQGPKGTSPTEQALFDALARTMPARWEGSEMVISECFVVRKPYKGENTTYYNEGQASGGAAAAGGGAAQFKGDLARFRKVVDMELDKARLRLDKGGLDRIGGAERKGG